MSAIFKFLGLTIVCIALSALFLALAFHVHSQRPQAPTQAEQKFSEPERPLRPVVLAQPLAKRLTPRQPAGFLPAARPKPKEEEEFRALFDSLRQALADGDGPALQSLFDFERMAVELEPYGVFESIPGGNTPSGRASFIRGMKEGLVKSAIANTIFRWERTQVRWVQRTADGREAVVTAHHRSAILGNRAYKIRWWLIRGQEGWYAYDMEELDMGIRMTRLSGSITPAIFREYRDNPGRLQLAVAAIRESLVAFVLRGDGDEADEKLQDARGVYLPPPIAALREMIEGLILLGRGAPEAAIKRLDEAERLQPGLPAIKSFRAMVEVANGRYAEALQLVDSFLAEVGPDPDALEVRGTALEGLDRIPEAIEAYRQALDELPDLVDSIHGLRRTLDQKEEIALRIARASNPLETFDAVFWIAREEGDFETLDVLRAWLRKAHPNDGRTIRLELSGLIEAGQTGEAAIVLRQRLASELEHELKQMALSTFLHEMIDIGRHLEAYLAVPDAAAEIAFRVLADDLDDTPIALPPHAGDRNAKLRRDLIASHRRRAPNDPWLWYCEGWLLMDEGRHAEAERILAEGQARVAPPKAKGPDDEVDDRDSESERFRWSRVQCLFEMKEGLRAYAEIGPPKSTFSQLASAYYWSKDAAGLEALLAAHRRRDPNGRQLAYWSAEVLYLRQKYAEASTALLKYVAELRDEDQNSWQAIDHAVRGFLRANRPERAQEAVAAIGAERVPTALRAAVHLAGGRPALAEEIIAREAKSQDGHGWLYYDEDFARLMKEPRFDALRKKYPDTRTNSVGGVPG